jgi:hypothetical protein
MDHRSRSDLPPGGHDTDRSFDELLQELRVAQTGVQILFAFLLTIPFAPGFQRLDAAQRNLYAVDVLCAVIAMALLVAPVAIHRVVFGRRLRPELVRVAHAVTLAGLVFLLVAVAGAVLLVSTVVFAPGTAGRFWLPIAALAVLLTCWVLLPLAIRAGRGRMRVDDEADEGPREA